MIGRRHEIHNRRFGKNLAVGLCLAAMIAIVFGLTVVKVTNGDFEPVLGEVQK